MPGVSKCLKLRYTSQLEILKCQNVCQHIMFVYLSVCVYVSVTLRVTCYMLRVPCSMSRATCFVLHVTCFMLCSSVKDTENKILTFVAGESGITIAVQKNGAVTRDPAYLLSSSCIIDIKYFPFDTQRCPIYISLWSYTADKVQQHEHSATGGILRERKRMIIDTFKHAYLTQCRSKLPPTSLYLENRCLDFACSPLVFCHIKSLI